MKRTAGWLSIALVLALAGCASDEGNSPGSSHHEGKDAAADSTGEAAADAAPDNAKPPEDAGDAGPDVTGDTGVDAGDAGASCASSQSYCIDHATRRYCQAGQWHEEKCSSGAGCFQGKCVTGSCSDECRLGEKNGGATCELFDVSTGKWVKADPNKSMHDRARSYLYWLHRDSMPFGGVANAAYSDPPTYSKIMSYHGLGDSAIWTGTYLAAEALRLKATGAPDARRAVRELVRTLHLWFNVSGQPGLLVRYVVPAGSHDKMPAFDCTKPDTHCNVEYKGKKYDYFGHISRDQYQGVMLGYAIAFEALGEADDDVRDLIRDDVAEFILELMKKRRVPIEVIYNGNPLPRMDITLRFAVLDPSEMHDGAITLKLNGKNYNDASLSGFQEFIPDLYPLLKQLPFGNLFPNPFPRAGSAVMLASYFNIARVVLKDSAKHRQIYDQAVSFYETNPDEWGNMLNRWLTVMKMWASGNKCGEKYYGNNITMEPMYNLGRLEANINTQFEIRSHVIEAKMWPVFEHTKNPFFSYVTLVADPNLPNKSAVIADALTQLSQFPPPPRVHVARDWRNSPKYQPHEQGCTDQVSHATAVDVGDRVVSDFIWQRQPWGLYDRGNPAQTYPGIDYLVAYWMGRHHGYISEDAPHTCAVWHK